MNKKIMLLTSIVLLGLASCGNILSTREKREIAQISWLLNMSQFVPPSHLTSSDINSSRAGIDTIPLTVVAELKKAFDHSVIESKSISAQVSNVVPIQFTVASNQTVYLEVSILSSNKTIFSGKSQSLTLHTGQNDLQVPVYFADNSFAGKRVLFEKISTQLFARYSDNPSGSLGLLTSNKLGDIDFDMDGTAYIMTENSVYAFTPEGSTFELKKELANLKGFAIDRMKNNIFVQTNSQIDIYALDSLNPSSQAANTVSSPLSTFTVYNNVLYGTNIDRATPISSDTIFAKYGIAGTDLEERAQISPRLSAAYDGYYINDIVYQDGFVWILISSIGSNTTAEIWGNIPMKGALLKIDPNSMTVTAEYGRSSGNRPPLNADSAYLYNPLRFAAFAPRTLVIADDGLTSNFHPQNRFVKFSTASNSFISPEEASAEFLTNFEIVGTDTGKYFLFNKDGKAALTDNIADPASDLSQYGNAGDSFGDIEFNIDGSAWFVKGAKLYQAGNTTSVIDSSDTINCFAIDKKTQQLYLATQINLEGWVPRLTRYSMFNFSASTNIMGDIPQNFAVHGNTAYGSDIARSTPIQKNVTKIFSYTISGISISKTGAAYTFTSDDLNAFYITDISYQEGFVWVLLKSTSNSIQIDTHARDNLKVKGALLKLNPETMQQEGLYGLTEKLRPDYLVEAPYYDPNDTNYFYGPIRFIALTPKKLVIADNAIGQNTSNPNTFEYKHRVIVFDLTSSELIPADTNVNFLQNAWTCGTWQ